MSALLINILVVLIILVIIGILGYILYLLSKNEEKFNDLKDYIKEAIGDNGVLTDDQINRIAEVTLRTTFKKIFGENYYTILDTFINKIDEAEDKTIDLLYNEVVVLFKDVEIEEELVKILIETAIELSQKVIDEVVE